MTRNYDNRGRDQINIEKVGGDVVIHQPRSSRSNLEWTLLQEVDREVESRLTQSLHNAAFINLGKQSQPEQVKRIWDAEVKIGVKPPEPLPPDVGILEVSERSDIAGKLLILGEPGAGKTTTMLDLAQALVAKAKQDASYPVPILINLSGWQEPRQSMPDWLVEELKSKYGVRKDIGKQWLQDKRLLPLLDGLDEVKPEHQEACVQAINQWLGSDRRPVSVVVCSRREEYASSQTQLHLNGAILLQALTDEQIQDYLIRVSRTELWHVLQQDTVLLNLMKTPLLLSITVLSYEALSLQQWHELTSPQQRLNLLLDAYIQTMLHRDLQDLAMLKRGWQSKSYRKRKPPTAARTRHWLTFLAQQLQRKSQTEFLLEKMQPSWLLKAKQRKLHKLISGLLAGLSYGLCVGSYVGVLYGLFSGLLVGLLTGLLVGLLGWLPKEIKPVETFTWSYKTAVGGLLVGLFGGLLVGLIGGLHFELLIGVFGWLLIGLLMALFSGLTYSEVETKGSPNQGIWKSAATAFYISMFFGLCGGLLVELLYWLIFGVLSGLRIQLYIGLPIGIPIGLFFGLLLGLFGGGRACIQHFALRLVLYHERSIPWNYARFLNYCTERLLLQRIGGRYRFVHKLLQERFAELGSGVDG